MLPHHVSAPQASRRIGVGIDASRYGHYAAFLRDDLQPAADELSIGESAAGYALFRQRLERIVHKRGPVYFVVRIDAAGQYADNLLHFLHRLGSPGADASASAPPFTVSVSCGDPQRNKNYRAALFGGKKSDPVEARAAARFAPTEKPASDTPLSLQIRTLRQVARRLQAVVRQRTRLINQFHHLLALTFPELALLAKDLAAGWVLELVHRYPTASRLAAAAPADLAQIAYLPDKHVAPLLDHARASIASLDGAVVEELLREQVRQLRDVAARQKRLENLLKKTGGGNLFMVFGEPDIDLKKQKDGKLVAEIRGLDVYDPTTGAVRSHSTDDIACWFLDTDYNGESFFVRHAYFCGGDEPYEKLKKALRAEIDEAEWAKLYSTKSLPFDPPTKGKIAVKVINHYGDEVLKVFRAP